MGCGASSSGCKLPAAPCHEREVRQQLPRLLAPAMAPPPPPACDDCIDFSQQ
jgi:hypothetical protein